MATECEYKKIQENSDKKAEDSPKQEQGITSKLLLTVISVAVGSCSHFGYNCGVISSPSQVIQAFYNSSHKDRRGTTLSEDSIRWLWAATVSIICLGGALGCILGGYLGDLIGRKRTLLANNVLSISAAVLVLTAKYINVYETIIVARFLAGINVGISFTVVNLYLAEISPKHVRGIILASSSFGANFGLICAMVLSSYVFNHDYDWPILLAIVPLLFSLFELLTLPFCPESPRWLLISKKDEKQARKALSIFRNGNDITHEIEEMYRESQQEGEEKIGPLQLLNPRTRRAEWTLPLAICIFIGFTNNFGGINMIWFYSSSILASAGLTASQISFSTVLFGVDAMITSAVGGKLLDKFGRRPMILFSSVVCSLLMIAFCLTTIFQDATDWMSWISIGIISSFIMFWNFGPGPVVWVVCPELWSQGPRQAGVSITMQGYWWSNFVCGQAMPFLQVAIGSYTFIIFSSVLFVNAIFIYLYVPETKNVSFSETAEYFRRRSLGINLVDDLEENKLQMIYDTNKNTCTTSRRHNNGHSVGTLC